MHCIQIRESGSRDQERRERGIARSTRTSCWNLMVAALSKRSHRYRARCATSSKREHHHHPLGILLLLMPPRPAWAILPRILFLWALHHFHFHPPGLHTPFRITPCYAHINNIPCSDPSPLLHVDFFSAFSISSSLFLLFCASFLYLALASSGLDWALFSSYT